MEFFRQLWNGVWHDVVPQDETVRWLVDTNLADALVIGGFAIALTAGFLMLESVLHWHYVGKSWRAFNRRNSLVTLTGDKSVYDMSDVELDAYEAGIDF